MIEPDRIYIIPPNGYLQMYATDIARGHDGQWRVIDNQIGRAHV